MAAEQRRVGWGALACLLLAGGLGLAWRPALSMPDAIRIPIVETHGAGAPAPAALFRHGRHDGYTCSACHPATFPQYAAGFTHADMNEGRFCAVCHDGRAATAVTSMACEACHVPN